MPAAGEEALREAPAAGARVAGGREAYLGWWLWRGSDWIEKDLVGRVQR